MNAPDRARIRSAFSAAQNYDRSAHIQRQVAQDLAERITGLTLPKSPKILEIGCGTGLLTEALASRLDQDARWLVTDISPAMVERTHARMGERAGWNYAVLDGERGDRPDAAPFDLICSSMTMQWFSDFPAAIARLIEWLAPGGQLVLTTLAAGTFSEWAAAHDAEGLQAGTPPLLTVDAIQSASSAFQAELPVAAHYVERHDNAAAFLHALKAIGAGTAAQQHRPLAPAALRRVMKRFEASGSQATYEVVTCHFHAPTAQAVRP